MSGSPVPGARAAVETARAAIARLDPARHAEDVAADLLEAWSDVEAALRALLGGSRHSGLDLVREARHQQLLGFDQANVLAGFQAVRDRTRESNYQPSDADVNAARLAMSALDAALAAYERGSRGAGDAHGNAASAPEAAPDHDHADHDHADHDHADHVHPNRPLGMRNSPLGTPEAVPLPQERSGVRVWLWVLALIVVLSGAGSAYYWYGGPRRDVVVRRAISEFDGGQTDAAMLDFRRVLLMDPTYTIARVYLARIARNAGNFPEANDQLQLALTADPENPLALREMGAYLFTAGQYELARKFYVRAVTADPEDQAAMGFLGCTLVKLGRVDEGERWITRAGPGVWTSCVTAGASQDSTSS